jgi:hypothetical protein
LKRFCSEEWSYPDIHGPSAVAELVDENDTHWYQEIRPKIELECSSISQKEFDSAIEVEPEEENEEEEENE